VCPAVELGLSLLERCGQKVVTLLIAGKGKA
jgi:hypothetical protein